MTGTVFQRELIELMRSVLEEATAMLPKAKRTSTVQADMACAILTCAAKGERDPTALKTAALSAVVDHARYSHSISEDRRAVTNRPVLLGLVGRIGAAIPLFADNDIFGALAIRRQRPQQLSAPPSGAGAAPEAPGKSHLVSWIHR